MDGENVARLTNEVHPLLESSTTAAVVTAGGANQGSLPIPPSTAGLSLSDGPALGTGSSSGSTPEVEEGLGEDKPDIAQRKKRELTNDTAKPSQPRSKSPKRDYGTKSWNALDETVLTRAIEEAHEGGCQPLFSDILEKLRSKNAVEVTASAETIYTRMREKFSSRARSGRCIATMIKDSYDAEKLLSCPVYRSSQSTGDSVNHDPVSPSQTVADGCRGSGGSTYSPDATSRLKSRGRNARPKSGASKTLSRSKTKEELLIRSAPLGVVDVMVSRMPTVAARVESHLPAALLQIDLVIDDTSKPLHNAVQCLQDGLKKGTRSNFHELVTNLEDAFRSLKEPSALPGVSELEAHLSGSVADVRNESKWRRELEPGACVICSRADLKQAQGELACSVCEEVIQIGGDYFVNIKDPKSGVRCLVHRNQGVPRHRLDDVVRISHRLRLAPVVSCEECRFVEHVACGMHVPFPNNGLEGPHFCSPCRNRMKNNAEEDIPVGSADWMDRVGHTPMTEAVETLLRDFLKIHQHKYDNIAFRQMSGKQVDGNVSVPDLLRVRGTDGNLSALPPTRVARAFFALFWRINGASTMVFAITTQTSEWGDMYIELLDSVNLMPLGLLRADVYRLVLLALIAHRRAFNDALGIVGKVKLWSSAAADGLSYLLHARPSTQINMKPEILRRSYLDTFKVSEQMGITAPAATRKAVAVERIGKSAVCVLDCLWEPNGGQISTRAGHAESIVQHINANPDDAQNYLKAIVKHSRSVTDLTTLGESGINAANYPSLSSAASAINAKLDRGEVESVGDLEKLWENMVSISRAESVDSLRVAQAMETHISKATREVAKLSGRLLGQEDLSLLFVPLERTILASAPGLKCHAVRAFCRADEADVLVAKMLTAKNHSGTLATEDDSATTDAAATSEDGRGPGTKIGEAPVDVAGGGYKTATKDEGTHARPDREHLGVDGNGASVDESETSAGKGSERSPRPKSVLLDPKYETKALLDQLSDRMRLAFEASDRSKTMVPCRPLFDSPTGLLEVCEDRGLQFDTPVNARYSTAALIYLSENPEALIWKCMKCKAAIQGVRFCCDTHAFIMCRDCVGIETAEMDRLVCPSGSCGAGVHPRKIPILEGAPSTSAAAAPPSARARASRRTTRSST